MNKISFANPTFLLVLLSSLIHQIPAAVSKPPYTPTDAIFLNCGSSDYVTIGGCEWTGDLSSKFSPLEPFGHSKSIPATALTPAKSLNDFPYMNARISRSQFTYTFPVTAGPKFIRMCFFPATYRGLNNETYIKEMAFFDITAGPYSLLRNFSASIWAQDWNQETTCVEYCVYVKENQRLNVTFSPFFGDSNETYAFINSIEIVSMPSDLYYTPQDGPAPALVGQEKQFPVQNDKALEMFCRLNVGGNTIPPISDTGMYRLWIDDSIYVYPFFGKPFAEPDISLNFSRIQAYTAPESVYESARSIGMNKTEGLLQNLTWQVPLDLGFRYLVRLHFCELDPQVKIKERLIIISIDNQTVDSGFDVFGSSGGRGIPIYRDYMVTNAEISDDSDYMLFISLHPNASSIYDVILNGLEVFKLSDSSDNLAGTNPETSVAPPPPPPLTPTPLSPAAGVSNTKKVLLIAIGSGLAGLLIVLSIACCIAIRRLRTRKHDGSSYDQPLMCCWWLEPYKVKSSKSKASSLPEDLCRYFSLDEIKTATNNFHEEIGKGGFGKVYRGQIDNGARNVAIKRLNPESGQGEQEFETEIKMLSQLRHVHLVSLIGYCYDRGEMILVYEYMSNGTLQEHLYDADNDPLPWKRRLEICIGAASGLHYLHRDAMRPVIHRDVKTSNILLDENWVAKVSDFGLSKLGKDDSGVSTLVKGTPGYLDPDYARLQQLTEKSDVYSFGVVLLEVLCARKPLNRKLPEEEQWNLAFWAKKCIKNATIHQIIDPVLVKEIAPECFDKFVEIVELCVRDKGIERPSMHDVTETLKFALQLQQAADAKKQEKDQNLEIVHQEVSYNVPRYTNVIGSSESEFLGSNSKLSVLDTSSSGWSFGLESGSITTCQTLSETPNTTA